MELIKIIAVIIIGFVVFMIFLWIIGALYDTKIGQNACKLWANQIKTYGTSSYSIPSIVAGYVTDWFCNLWWF